MMNVPIAIDNGTYQCRAGFTNKDEPQLVFKNLVAKLRKERGKKDVDNVQVGNEIDNLDNVRFALKSQFDRNAILYTDVQEAVFDYVFASLNLAAESSIDHPIVLSEPILNPNYCRQSMSELLFECYNVPSLALGNDALFSLRKNFPAENNSLLLSLGYRTIHVLPFLDGRLDPINARRINLGGFEMISYLCRLLQLKYPSHSGTFSFGKAEEIFHDKSYIALDYFEEATKWSNLDFYNEHVLRIQPPGKSSNSAAQSELLKERRKEIARKMVEMNARKREEKLAEDEERLELLNEIKAMVEEGGDLEEIERALKAANVTSVGELVKVIAILKSRIYKAKNRSKPEQAPAATSESVSQQSQDESSLMKEKMEMWIAKMKHKRAEILKKRAQRRQKRSDMAKRRTAAAQERMRILSQLARKEKHDTFGMKDEDWDVYKAIQKDGGGSDSEDEQEQLNELEQALKMHDPTFKTELETEVKSREDDRELHVGLETVRAAELIFQPSMIGESQAGLVETIEHVLKLYPSDTQNSLVSNVFVSGGLGSLQGVRERLEKQLMEIRPFQSTFKINVAQNPSLDAWCGMREMCREPSSEQYFMTRAEYLEKGGEYFKEHASSNKYFATPQVKVEPMQVDSPVITAAVPQTQNVAIRIM